jgi:hypothetical protein
MYDIVIIGGRIVGLASGLKILESRRVYLLNYLLSFYNQMRKNKIDGNPNHTNPPH